MKHIPIVDICNLSEQKNNDILVSRFGPYLVKHRNLFMAHRHHFYHLVFFTKGEGFHTIDFSQFAVRPYQIYFMTPGQVHSWQFEGQTDGYVVNFSPAFFHTFIARADYLESFSFFNGIAVDSVLNLDNRLGMKVKELFEEILLHDTQRGILYEDLMRSLLLQMFLLIDQQNLTQKPQTIPAYHYTLLKNFQKLLDKHFMQLKLPMEYADLLFITPNHLNALCKEHWGMQAGEVIRNRIILEAKRLLVNQQTSISEIAYTLNFKDNSYFSKFFKKSVGITPEEFRKRIIQ